MKRLSADQVKKLHEELIAHTGGSSGLRDNALLESALNAPFQTFDNEPLYPSIQQKASRLAYSIVNNHPFVDGNKRIGIHAMLVFLEMNGIELTYNQEELVTVGLGLVSSQMKDKDLLLWIISHQT